METAMEEEGFEDMVAYVPKRNNMAAQYIAIRPIMDLCEGAVQRPGSWVAMIWWVHKGLDLAGAREAAAAAANGEGGREGERRIGRRRWAGAKDMGYTVAN